MSVEQPALRRPVRVLHVLAFDAVGGTETMVATLVEAHDRKRIAPEVACLSPPGPVAERLRATDVPVHSLGAGVAGASRLARLLRRGRYDIVSAYGLRATMLSRFSIRLLARETAQVVGVRGLHVTDVEDVGGLKSRLILAVERASSRWVDAYDANSRGAVRLLVAHGIPEPRITYIPNGIDTCAWRVRTREPVPGGPPRIACVARFTRLKRHGDLVRALRLLADAGVELRATLAGEGPLLGDVRALVADLDLAQTVETPGALPAGRVKSLLATCDVFCLASLWEGMPGAVLEAMAAGLPVVATRVNGIEDVVEDGTTGLLVPPQRPDLLAEALAAVLADPARAARMGAAGRERVERMFSLEAMVASKEALYERVAEAAG